MKIEGKPYSPADFATHVAGLVMGDWRPSQIVIHHCSAPSLAQRPKGFIPQHMLNLKEYYEGKKWSAGPHLFTDDSRIWTFSPMTAPGVHAVSFNRTSIGIEMLGDYDDEDPWSGRGLQVLTTTAKAVHALLRKFQLDPAKAVRFHREDPKTQKTCPGIKINKAAFMAFLKTQTPAAP